MNKLFITIALTVLTAALLFSVLPTNFGNAQVTYKISGYVKDVNGQGISGANVLFPEVATVLTNNSGYYQLFAPAGTYILGVWPPFDSNYINYAESAFAVTSNANKNITLQTGIKVSGYIKGESGSPVLGASVHFSGNGGYYSSGWFTNQAGYYFINVPTGTYTITAAPREGNYAGPTTNFTAYTENNFLVNTTQTKNITVQTINTPTPTPTVTPAPTPAPSGGTEIFKIESNSTWSNLYFNSTTLTLTFTVSGENGTTGYTKAHIAKTLAPTFTGATVSLDGKSTNFTVTQTADYWIFDFTYHHSTHQVAIDLTNDMQNPTDISTIPEFTTFAAVTSILLVSTTLALVRKKITPK